MSEASIPVLTIDGPSGSGKGSISRGIARRLGWHFLDSGAIYRSLAVAAEAAGVALDDVESLTALARTMALDFTADEPPCVLLNGVDIADRIVTERAGNSASKVAALGPVRRALLEKQRDFRQAPGLVADGRDMGTVVFADAPYKVFLTASAEVRAQRRYKQLKEKGVTVNLEDLTREIEERDRRDRERAEAPLIMADGAVLIDSSELSIDEVMARTLAVLGR